MYRDWTRWRQTYHKQIRDWKKHTVPHSIKSIKYTYHNLVISTSNLFWWTSISMMSDVHSVTCLTRWCTFLHNNQYFRYFIIFESQSIIGDSSHLFSGGKSITDFTTYYWILTDFIKHMNNYKRNTEKPLKNYYYRNKYWTKCCFIWEEKIKSWTNTDSKFLANTYNFNFHMTQINQKSLVDQHNQSTNLMIDMLFVISQWHINMTIR